jgi:hypothetical protein
LAAAPVDGGGPERATVGEAAARMGMSAFWVRYLVDDGVEIRWRGRQTEVGGHRLSRFVL